MPHDAFEEDDSDDADNAGDWRSRLVAVLIGLLRKRHLQFAIDSSYDHVFQEFRI